MTEPVSQFFTFLNQKQSCKIHYLDWGASNLPILICAHGLTRNARDFDFLARSISDQFRVIAIDFPGRGLSDWLDDKTNYSMPLYLNVIESLLNELDINSFNWLGTSMGGLIGIILATQKSNTLKRLIINDVGPEIPTSAVDRISDYLSTVDSFDSQKEFEGHIRQIYAPFGKLTDQQWRHLAEHSQRIDSKGKLASNYDPDIAIPFKQALSMKADLWGYWQAISTPVYLLHGINSDILNTAILAKMKQLQPGLKSRSIERVGHAPALMNESQIQLVRDWLND